MPIRFSGQFSSPLSPDQVFDFLSDPNRFGPLLPEFQGMTLQDATHFTVKVNVGVAHIRGSAEIKMELSEAVPGRRALYRGQGNAVGSQITLYAGFDLFPLAGSTQIAWQGEANIFGKLASLGGGLLEPLAGKNITKLIDSLQRALADLQPKHASELMTQDRPTAIENVPETDHAGVVSRTKGNAHSPDSVQGAQSKTEDTSAAGDSSSSHRQQL